MLITVVNSQAASLHESFGITEERSDELCDRMSRLSKEGLRLSEFVSIIASHCTSNEELAFVCYTHGRWMEKTNQFKKQ